MDAQPIVCSTCSPKSCQPLPLRILLGIGFLVHGAPKLFSAAEHAGFAGMLQQLGIPAAGFLAWVVGFVEFFGGIALAFGLFARLAGAAIFGDMMIAIITVTWANGINATGGKSGYELNLALGVLALMVAFFGAGRVSVDALLERRVLAMPRPD